MTRKLLILNGLAILCIPLHHAAAYGLQAMFYWTDRYRSVSVPNFDQVGSLQFHVTTAIRQLDAFSVPAFLFISGFFIAFMAKGDKSTVTWKTVLPRIKVLIFPFLIWTVIRYLLIRRIPASINEILDPYHFIPLLIQFYLLSPFLVPVAKKYPVILLLGAAFVHLGIQSLRYLNGLGINDVGQEFILGLIPRWTFLGQQPFWFPFGLVVGLHLQKFQILLGRLKRALLPGTVALASMAIVEVQVIDQLNGDLMLSPSFAGISRTFYVLAFLLWFLAFNESLIPSRDMISNIGTKSLGIYMANIPAIYVVAVLMYRFTPWILGKQLLYQGILFSAGLGLPILLMEIVRRSPARPLYRLIFG